MAKSHQNDASDMLFKNFTTNIQNYLAWRAKWLKNRKLIYPLNKDIKKELAPFIKKTNQAKAFRLNSLKKSSCLPYSFPCTLPSSHLFN